MGRQLRLLFFVLVAVVVCVVPASPASAGGEKTIEVGADTSTRDAFDHLWGDLSKFDGIPDVSDSPDVALENDTNGFCAAKALHEAKQTMFLAKLGPAITRSMSMTLSRSRPRSSSRRASAWAGRSRRSAPSARSAPSS